jgi:hypothetical protein
MERFFSVIHIVCPAPSRLAFFDQGFGHSVCWVLELRELGMWVRDFNRARRRHFEVDVTARTRDEPRAGSANCYPIAFFSFPPICLPLCTRWPVPLSALYLTSTSPTRHAPRRSRNLPRHTPSQASNDVQCHAGEGHPSNMQKVHGQCMWFLGVSGPRS